MNSFTIHGKMNILFLALLLVLANFSISKKISNPDTKENQTLRSILSLQPSNSSSLLSTSTSTSMGNIIFPMKNIDYLFHGYNLYRGNPHSTTGSIDPGFTNPIFVSDYSNKKKTGDLRFLVANGSTFTKNVGCDVSMTNTEIRGATSYKSALDVDVSVSGAFWGVSFAASASYKDVSENMKSFNTVYVEQKADCRVFQGHIEHYRPPLFYESFIIALKFLNDKDFDKFKDDYYFFIDYYGTHYLEKITMGARYGLLHKMSIDEYSTFKSTAVKVAVSGSGYGFSASASVGKSSAKSDSGSKSFGSTKVFSIGASPPASGNPMDWAASAISEPMPISYKLRPMMEILNNPFFNLTQLTSNKVDVGRLKNNLGKAYANYCQDYLKKNGKLKFCTEKEVPKEVQIPDNKDDDKPKDEIKLISSTYSIMFRNLETNNCLTAQVKNIISSRCDEKSSSQRWKIKYNPDTISYRISTSSHPELVGDRDSSKSSQLQLWKSHNKDNQRISFQKMDINVYSIIVKGECLQVKNNNKADNAPLEFSKCKEDKSQEWMISK